MATEFFVLPTGEGDGKRPWIFLSLIVAPQDEEELSSAETAAESASLTEEVQHATSTASGSTHESYRREVCISLNLDIFVTFMDRLEELPHRQVLMYECACVSRACTQCFTGVCIEHHIRAFQGLNSVLAQYIFRIFNVCQITRKIALSSRAGPGKHAREGVFRIGPRVRLICHFCQNDALKTLAGQRSRVHLLFLSVFNACITRKK